MFIRNDSLKGPVRVHTYEEGVVGDAFWRDLLTGEISLSGLCEDIVHWGI